MEHLVGNTNSYTQKQLLGPVKERQHSWQPHSTQELYIRLATQIHMDRIQDSFKWYRIKEGVYLLKDRLPPAMNLHQQNVL
jgi:hypothetical protein